jgi:hypothetical protein
MIADWPLLRWLTVECLREIGYTVMEADSGRRP